MIPKGDEKNPSDADDWSTDPFSSSGIFSSKSLERHSLHDDWSTGFFFLSSDAFPSKSLEKGDLARGERLFTLPIYVPVVFSTIVAQQSSITILLSLSTVQKG
jgi:hypothetical protein